MKACLGYQGLVGDSEVRRVLIQLGHGRGKEVRGSGCVDHRLMPLGRSWETAESGLRRGSQGRGLTWGPTVQQLHKVGWEGSQLPVLLPQPPAVLNLGRGEYAGASGSAPRFSRNLVPSALPKTPSSPTSTSPSLRPSSFPEPPPSLHSTLLSIEHPYHLPKPSHHLTLSPPLSLPQSPQLAASARPPAPDCS